MSNYDKSKLAYFDLALSEPCKDAKYDDDFLDVPESDYTPIKSWVNKDQHKEVLIELKQVKTSEAQKRAIYKYDDKFERVNCRFEIGTKERIINAGYSINSFIKLAVEEKLDREEY